MSGPRRPGGRRARLLLAVGAVAALTGCSGSAGSRRPRDGVRHRSGSPSGGAGASTAPGTPGPSGAGVPAAATTAGGVPDQAVPSVAVPAERSGIVIGRTSDLAGRPLVVADAGTVVRAVRAVLKAAGAPQARLLGVLGVGFTDGRGLLRVAVQDPADPAAGLEYSVDAEGTVVGPRSVPGGRLLKRFPAPATPERVTALGFTLAQAPLARLDDALARAVRAGRVQDAGVVEVSPG